MAQRFHLRPRAAALVLYCSAFAAGCGGEDEAGDTDTSAASAMGPRQRIAGNGTATGTEDPARTRVDDGAETAQQGDLDVAETDAEPAASGDATEDEPEVPSPPAQVITACWADGGRYDCDAIYVVVQQADPERCVQLTIDNCDGYSRRTLGVDTPSGWDLVSGAIGSNAEACELGVFNASNTIVLDATGTVSWSNAAAAPTDLELELTLEPSQTTGVVPSVDVTTSDPVALDACPE